MAAQFYSKKPVQLQAMQLRMRTNPAGDNAMEVAQWCGGQAVWEYDGPSMLMKVEIVIIDEDQINMFRVLANDWVLQLLNGRFVAVKDADFRNDFDTEPFDAPPTCSYCLSDPRCTPMGDPHQKNCPACGVGYSGSPRTKEYAVLAMSGLVSVED